MPVSVGSERGSSTCWSIATSQATPSSEPREKQSLSSEPPEKDFIDNEDVIVSESLLKKENDQDSSSQGKHNVDQDEDCVDSGKVETLAVDGPLEPESSCVGDCAGGTAVSSTDPDSNIALAMQKLTVEDSDDTQTKADCDCKSNDIGCDHDVENVNKDTNCCVPVDSISNTKELDSGGVDSVTKTQETDSGIESCINSTEISTQAQDTCHLTSTPVADVKCQEVVNEKENKMPTPIKKESMTKEVLLNNYLNTAPDQGQKNAEKPPLLQAEFPVSTVTIRSPRSPARRVLGAVQSGSVSEDEIEVKRASVSHRGISLQSMEDMSISPVKRMSHNDTDSLICSDSRSTRLSVTDSAHNKIDNRRLNKSDSHMIAQSPRKKTSHPKPERKSLISHLSKGMLTGFGDTDIPQLEAMTAGLSLKSTSTPSASRQRDMSGSASSSPARLLSRQQSLLGFEIPDGSYCGKARHKDANLLGKESHPTLMGELWGVFGKYFTRKLIVLYNRLQL